MRPAIVFDRVWKKFRRGERHDSLRDLIPSIARRWIRRRKPAPERLEDQEFWALSNVSFDVGPGQALGIVGPNGAGKSTVLKLLTRILKPTRGRCEVRGRVGALIELAAGFHPDLTGRENIFLQGAIMGMRRAEIARKFSEIVEFSGLADFIDTQVKRYSSGMNARLGFSIAAHLDPDVLLIDEVLAVGDLGFQQRCHERLAGFRRAGIAIAFVSHNLQAVAQLCDRALLLTPGAGPRLGEVHDVLSAYASGATATGDPRVRVHDARLFAGGGEDDDGRGPGARPIVRPVKPGTPVTLRLDVEASADLPRCGLGLLVSRSDGLLVFDGASTVDGVRPVELRRGERLRCSVSFRANVLRGTYLVGALLFDSFHGGWDAVRLPGLASFVVSETTRRGGCVELQPTYDLQVGAEDGARA